MHIKVLIIISNCFNCRFENGTYTPISVGYSVTNAIAYANGRIGSVFKPTIEAVTNDNKDFNMHKNTYKFNGHSKTLNTFKNESTISLKEVDLLCSFIIINGSSVALLGFSPNI